MVQRFTNPDGPTISTATGRVVQVDGRTFRDLAGTGELIAAADWRLDATARARDLASRMSLEQIAGLMLYSPHQMVPSRPGGPFSATYAGADYDEAANAPHDLTDQQRDLLLRDHIRHVLVIAYQDVDTAVTWHNAMQELAENEPLSIPVNFSSDPRHGANESGAEFRSSGAAVSKWPEGIGLAAIGSTAVVRQFADTVRQEYRALGITTALGPQIDLATEPRWMRAVDTFGGDVTRSIAFTRAYLDALQTTPGSPDGWGPKSVIGMAKHWPGGGTGEGGRDAHYRFGEYNVYPGGNFAEHLRPFTEGAFALEGPTQSVGAIMPYYSVSVGHTEDERGNSYSAQIMSLLRDNHEYDGVVCTDWGITGDPGPMDSFAARCFGVEELSIAERHLLLVMNGVDQFGGNSDAGPVIEAYHLGCERFGEQLMRTRYEQAAVRLLRGIVRVGLLDNPYLDLDESRATVGRPEFVAAGFQAQLASIVALKKQAAPLAKGTKVWLPDRHIASHKGFFRQVEPARDVPGLPRDIASEYLTLVDNPEDADAALVVMTSPMSDPYVDDQFRPISLQYRPYGAETAREQSLAGDRSYRGHPAVIANEADLDNLEQARAAMGDKPVVAVVQLDTPVVLGEVEPLADNLFVHYGVSARAVLDVVTGAAVAGGRLPAAMPASMTAIEASSEDIFDDYAPYVDTVGNVYASGFGLEAS